MSRYASIIRAVLLDACADGKLPYPAPLDELGQVEARMAAHPAMAVRMSLEDLSVGEFRAAALWAAGAEPFDGRAVDTAGMTATGEATVPLRRRSDLASFEVIAPPPTERPG